MEISFSPQLLHQQQQQEGSHNNYMMTNILIIFLTSIAFVANSFKKQYAKEAEQPHGDDEESSDDSYCSVCLSQFCKGEKLRILPICNHRYHSDCIAAWLKNHTTCPLCRNNIIDHHVSDNNNQHKFLHVKQFKESMIGVLLGFSDLLVGVVYMMLPTTIRETFPLVH